MLIRKPLFLMAEGDGAGAGEGAPDGGGSTGGSDAGKPSGGDDGGKSGDEGKTFTQADVDRIIAGRLSKYADYDQLRQERDQLQQANQSEQEKAVDAARKEGQAEARLEAAKDLAREVFNGAAARRNAEFDTSGPLGLIDLGRFVKKDGSVDRDAVASAVEQMVPEKQEPKTPPSFGGGPRKSDTKTEATPGMGRLRAAYADTAKK